VTTQTARYWCFWFRNVFGNALISAQSVIKGITLRDGSGTAISYADARAYSPENRVDSGSGTRALLDADSSTFCAFYTATDYFVLFDFGTAVTVGSYDIQGSASVKESPNHWLLMCRNDYPFDWSQNWTELGLFQIASPWTASQTKSFNLSDANPPFEEAVWAQGGQTSWVADSADMLLTDFGDATGEAIWLGRTGDKRQSYWGDGIISGSVTDSSGFISGAKVYLVDPANRNHVAETTADGVGFYQFLNLDRTCLFDIVAQDPAGLWEKRVSSSRRPWAQAQMVINVADEPFNGQRPGQFGIQLNSKESPKLVATFGVGEDTWTALNCSDPFFKYVTALIRIDDTGAIYDMSKTQMAHTSGTAAASNVVTPPTGFGNNSLRIGVSGDAYSFYTFSNFPNVMDRDFTCEYYLYPLSSPGASQGYQICFDESGWQSAKNGNYLFYTHPNTSPSQVNFLTPQQNVSWIYLFGGNPAGSGTANALTMDAWQHVEVSRQNNTYRIFIDGVKKTEQSYTTYSVANDLYPNVFMLGVYTYSTPSYMTGIRFTDGICRHTATFTPPTFAEMYQ
jgi:hypothetical protein